MAISLFRQETQLRNSDLYDDTVAVSEANFETNPGNIEDDLNNLRSQISNLMDGQVGDWFTDLATPSALETGTQRGVNDLNDSLHAVEKKRILRSVHHVGTEITVPATQNYKVLALAELPSNTTSAVGAVATLGTVSAHVTVFAAHALDEVAGTNALSPKNLCAIVDATTGDPLLSGGYQVYALFQVENATNGTVLTGTTPNRAQLSFVRPNATFDDLEACPVADIENQVINYCSRERVRLEDLAEQDFLRGATVDVGAGSGVIDRQTAYDSQGVTPVDVTTNSILDLEAAGLTWEIRDDLQASLFKITEGSAGGTSVVALGPDVDTFDSDAILNDFRNGAKFDTDAADTTIDIGVTAANQITSGGALTIKNTGANDLSLVSSQEMLLDDANQTGSTWAQTGGIKLSETTAEWDAFETEFGEVSLLNAIVAAKNTSGRRRVFANVTANLAADVDVSGPANDNNLDANLGDLSGGAFIDDYDIYLNGQYQRPGANAAANNDVYPGTALANGQLKFEKKLKTGDVIAIVDYIG